MKMKAAAVRVWICLCSAGACLMAQEMCVAADTLRVVTTTADLKSIAEAVGRDHVTATSISTGTQDPHFIEAKPSYMMLAQRADLWVRIGLELEIGYEPLILKGSRNPRIHVGQPGHLDASEGVRRLEVPTTTQITRAMGDVHPLGNPHYHSDPFNGRIIARNIRDRLIRLDPENGAAYKANCAAFIRQLDTAAFGEALLAAADGDTLWAIQEKGLLDAFLEEHPTVSLGGWLGQMKPFVGTKIVTYHRGWCYFAKRFGLEIVGELEPKPGIPPSPGHLIDLAKVMQAEGVRLILMKPFYSRKAPDLLAQKTGAAVLVVADSAGGSPEAKDYISMLDNAVRQIARVLSQEAENARGTG